MTMSSIRFAVISLAFLSLATPAKASQLAAEADQLQQLWHPTAIRSSEIQRAVRRIDKADKHRAEVSEIFSQALRDSLYNQRLSNIHPYIDKYELAGLWNEAQQKSPLVQAFMRPFVERGQSECGRNYLLATQEQLEVPAFPGYFIRASLYHIPIEHPLSERPRFTDDPGYYDIANEAKWLKQNYCAYVEAWVRLSHSDVSHLAENTTNLELARKKLSDLVSVESVQSISSRLDKLCATKNSGNDYVR